jgi:hypothetical protein
MGPTVEALRGTGKRIHESACCRLAKHDWENEFVSHLQPGGPQRALRVIVLEKAGLYAWKLRSHPEKEMALPSI